MARPISVPRFSAHTSETVFGTIIGRSIPLRRSSTSRISILGRGLRVQFDVRRLQIWYAAEELVHALRIRRTWKAIVLRSGPVFGLPLLRGSTRNPGDDARKRYVYHVLLCEHRCPTEYREPLLPGDRQRIQSPRVQFAWDQV